MAAKSSCCCCNGCTTGISPRIHDRYIIGDYCWLYFDGGRRIWHNATRALRALAETGSLHLRSNRALELDSSPRLEDHVGLSVAERTRSVSFTECGLDW